MMTTRYDLLAQIGLSLLAVVIVAAAVPAFQVGATLVFSTLMLILAVILALLLAVLG